MRFWAEVEVVVGVLKGTLVLDKLFIAKFEKLTFRAASFNSRYHAQHHLQFFTYLSVNASVSSGELHVFKS